jgi:FkbM family methyltransferase
VLSRPRSLDLARAAASFLRRASARLARVASRLDESPLQEQMRRWSGVCGDKTLRLEYELHEESIVFDVGGYEGQWASDIFGMYACRIHIFEPVEQFADQIRRRFARNHRVTVWSFGLSDRDRTVHMGLDGDASSVFRSGRERVTARLVCFAGFVRKHSTDRIDLMKVNIEGGEYDLLEHVLETGLIGSIGNIQVQFHEGVVSNDRHRMEAIQRRLRETHFLTYQYPYLWENWQLRSSASTNEVERRSGV